MLTMTDDTATAINGDTSTLESQIRDSLTSRTEWENRQDVFLPHEAWRPAASEQAIPGCGRPALPARRRPDREAEAVLRRAALRHGDVCRAHQQEARSARRPDDGGNAMVRLQVAHMLELRDGVPNRRGPYAWCGLVVREGLLGRQAQAGAVCRAAGDAHHHAVVDGGHSGR